MKHRRIDDSMPDDLLSAFEYLGKDLCAARRARRMSQDDMADRLNVGRRTVVRMEKGDHRVGFGTYVTAAWVMGLEKHILEAFDRHNDPVQMRGSRFDLPRRVDSRGSEDDGPSGDHSDKRTPNPTELDF